MLQDIVHSKTQEPLLLRNFYCISVGSFSSLSQLQDLLTVVDAITTTVITSSYLKYELKLQVLKKKISQAIKTDFLLTLLNRAC